MSLHLFSWTRLYKEINHSFFIASDEIPNAESHILQLEPTIITFSSGSYRFPTTQKLNMLGILGNNLIIMLMLCNIGSFNEEVKD